MTISELSKLEHVWIRINLLVVHEYFWSIKHELELEPQLPREKMRFDRIYNSSRVNISWISRQPSHQISTRWRWCLYNSVRGKCVFRCLPTTVFCLCSSTQSINAYYTNNINLDKSLSTTRSRAHFTRTPIAASYSTINKTKNCLTVMSVIWVSDRQFNYKAFIISACCCGGCCWK